MPPVLEVHNLSKHFRGVAAVNDFSVNLEPGSIYGLIGPNGAGKTTVFNVLSGEQKPNSGCVRLCGRDITGWRPDAIAALGMARTFQNLRLFGTLSVLDNVLIGAQIHKEYGFLSTLVSGPRLIGGEHHLREEAHTLLQEMGIGSEAYKIAGSLPYGKQRKLEIARAMATRPRLLLLDEPAAGMNPSESHDLMDTIRRVRERYDLTVLLIEHDMNLVMSLCERLQVLCYGTIIAEGTPAAIKDNPQVIEAYLGRRTVGAQA
jgi:branched-chain amino acid transport system ATP-binding protein